ncbi:MAG: GDSL-type esterase/lipase family protein [Candidatus Sumerlaeota bacterium]|nr:GDSL-type esterase/lipase family protein [Candidatus Sumerlaeota bacterium]
MIRPLSFVLCPFVFLLACVYTQKTPVSPTGEWMEESAAAVVRDDIKPAGLAYDRAVRTAEDEARARILNRLAAVEVRPGSSVVDEMNRDPYAYSKVMGVLKATRSYDTKTLDNGRVEIHLRVDSGEIRRICLETRGPGSAGLPGSGAPLSGIPTPPPAILAFGDSLTAGVGASLGKDVPSQLSRLLGQPVVNLGVAGATTADGLRRIDTLLVHKPRLIIVFFGANDFLRAVPVEEMESNLGQILDRCQRAGVKVALVGFSDGLGQPIDSMFNRLAARPGVVFVPDVLKDLHYAQTHVPGEVVQYDDDGYAIIAQRIAERVKPALQP